MRKNSNVIHHSIVDVVIDFQYSLLGVPETQLLFTDKYQQRQFCSLDFRLFLV